MKPLINDFCASDWLISNYITNGTGFNLEFCHLIDNICKEIKIVGVLFTTR